MSSIDQQFIEFIVKSLVGKPDEVKIDRRIDEKGVLLELTVDPEDLGRVIGKRGATAQSLRTLLRALGTKNDARYNLKIVDNGEPRPPREDYAPVSHDDAPRNEVSKDDAPKEDGMFSRSSEPVAKSEDKPADDDSEFMTSLPKDDEDHDSVLSKTRKELEELDDLDV
jgi:uncharacterized protein